MNRRTFVPKCLVPLSAVLVTALSLTFATGGVSLAQTPQPGNRPLAPQQQARVDAKEQERARAGAPAKPPQNGAFVQPGQPVRQFTGRVKTTKTEMLAQLAAAEAADQQYFSTLERLGGADLARQKRSEYEAARRRIEALPDGPVEQEIPGVELGHRSINFSRETYDMDTSQLNKKDPINFIFYRVGSAWDVNYDLKNWTSARWQDTGCNGNQRVYIWDAMHTGGQDAWRTNQYPMEPAGTSPCWPTARDHIRLFEGFVRDSHDPSWGVWSITSAHHDNYGHSQTDDWEGPEGRLRGAFYDGSGNKLWFVGAVWDVDLGNAGQWQGAYNNGLASVVELLY